MGLDIGIDRQDFPRQLLRRRVKERDKPLPDTLRHRYSKRRKVSRHIADSIKAIRISDLSRDRDRAAPQPILNRLNDVPVILLALQHPGIDPLPQGEDFEFSENFPPFQLIQQVVLKLRDQRHRCFSVHLLKESLSIPRRAEDDAFPGFRSFVLAMRFLCVPFIIQRQQGRLRINAVVTELPLIPLRQCLYGNEMLSRLNLQISAAKNSVRQATRHFGIPSQPDGPQDLPLADWLIDHHIGIGREPDPLCGILIAHPHEITF